MPIYEFYCGDCHRLFNFLAARVDTESRPACPRCGRAALERRLARFATVKRRHGDDSDPLEEIDEERLAGVMDSMMAEMGGLDDGDDPRRLADLLRRFGDSSGLEFGPRMQEMLGRLEAGEDPDRLDDEYGDELDDVELEEFVRLKRSGAWRRRPPAVDDELYFL